MTTNASTIPIYGSTNNELTAGSEGFIAIDITTSEVLHENTALIYAVKNPLSYIFNAVFPYNWYTDDETYRNDVLWGDGEKKSAYDPCPVGWRVPTDASKTFGDFSNTTFLYYIHGSQTSSGSYNMTNGCLYNQISWFPAAGYRSDNGVLYRVGNYGNCWSASVSGVPAKRLYFDMENVNHNATSYRRNGYALRCVQE